MKTKPENCIRAFANLEQIDNCKKQIDSIENSLNLMASALELVGNNVRLKILYLLNQHTFAKDERQRYYKRYKKRNSYSLLFNS